MKTQKFMLGDIPAILWGEDLKSESMSMSTAR